MMVNSLRFCDTGMKLPSWVEQGRTELKGPALAQVGRSAESRREQKEGYY
jgi:hypothetical protein